MMSSSSTSKVASVSSIWERIGYAIIFKELNQEFVEVLEKHAEFFVLWYEYKKGIKLDVEDGLLFPDYQEGTAKLNKNIEKAIDGLLDDTPLKEYSVECEGWEAESMKTFRELFYDENCPIEYYALYFLVYPYSTYANKLDVVSMVLANFELKTVLSLEGFLRGNISFSYCVKTYDTLIESSVVYLRDNFSFQPLEGKGIRILKDSDAFGITVEGKHYLLFNGTNLFEAELNSDDDYMGDCIYEHVDEGSDLWDCNYNCVVNDRYLFMYADSLNCVFSIDLESDADTYHTKFYDLHRVNDKKLLSLVKRTKLLNGGMN